MNGIQTPLFNPLNVFDDNRINSLIRKNFCEEDFVVTDELRTFVSKGSLVDMIDFSRVYFSKEIKTTFTSKLSFFDEEKYELKSLGALAVFLQRGKNPKYDDNGYQVIKSGQARGGVEFDFSKTYYASNYDEDDKRILCKGDILINSTGVGTAGRVTFFNLEGKYVVDNHITILRTSANVYNLYVFYALAYGVGFKNIEALASGTSGQIELSVSAIENIKIPLPPMDVQKKIVEECEKIDLSFRSNFSELNSLKQELSDYINNIQYGSVNVKGGKRIPKGLSYVETPTGHPYIRVADFSAGTVDTSNLIYITDDIFNKIKAYTISSDDVYISIAGTIGAVGIIPSSLSGANLTENAAKLVFDKKKVNKDYLAAILTSSAVQEQIINATKTVGVPKLALHRIENLQIQLPALEVQNGIAEHVNQIKRNIETAKNVINSCPSAKQAILDKYLK